MFTIVKATRRCLVYPRRCRISFSQSINQSLRRPSWGIGRQRDSFRRAFQSWANLSNCFQFLWRLLPNCGATCFSVAHFPFPPESSSLRIVVNWVGESAATPSPVSLSDLVLHLHLTCRPIYTNSQCTGTVLFYNKKNFSLSRAAYSCC